MKLIGISGKMGAGKDALARELCRRRSTARAPVVVKKFATALRRVSAAHFLPRAAVADPGPAAFFASEEGKAARVRVDLAVAAANVAPAVFDATGKWPDARTVAAFRAALVRGLAGAGAGKNAHVTVTVGRVLQVVGTDCFRDVVARDVWVDALFRDAAAAAAAEVGPRPGAAAAVVVVTDVRFPNEAAAIRRAGGAVVRVTRAGAGAGAGLAAGRGERHASETALDGPAGRACVDFTVVNDGDLDALYGAFARAVGPAALARLSEYTQTNQNGTPLRWGSQARRASAHARLFRAAVNFGV